MTHRSPNEPDIGDLVLFYDDEDCVYFAFVHAISIPGTSYELLFADGTYIWIDGKHVEKFPVYWEQEVDQTSETEDLDAVVIDNSRDSSSDSVLESIPLDEPSETSDPSSEYVSDLPKNFKRNSNKKQFRHKRSAARKHSRRARFVCCGSYESI